MFKPDGTITISGRVILKHANRNLFVIERARIARVYIEGRNLSWVNFGEEQAYEADIGSDSVCKIFDAIIYETKDIVFIEQTEDDGETVIGWRRLTRDDSSSDRHPGNKRP